MSESKSKPMPLREGRAPVKMTPAPIDGGRRPIDMTPKPAAPKQPTQKSAPKE